MEVMLGQIVYYQTYSDDLLAGIVSSVKEEGRCDLAVFTQFGVLVYKNISYSPTKEPGCWHEKLPIESAKTLFEKELTKTKGKAKKR